MKLSKAITDISMGQRLSHDHPLVNRPHNPNLEYYDYTHAMDENQRALFPHFRIVLRESKPRGDNATRYINAELVEHHPTQGAWKIGNVEGTYHYIPGLPKTLWIGYANLLDHHQGHGLGRALYKAVMAHSKHTGIERIAGGKHPTTAQRAHTAIAAEHGMNYHADRNIDRWDSDAPYADTADFDAHSTAPMDDKYRSYGYTLKMEKAIKDIPVGGKTVGVRGINYYDYTHVLPAELRNDYKLTIIHSPGYVGARVYKIGQGEWSPLAANRPPQNQEVGSADAFTWPHTPVAMMGMVDVERDHRRKGIGTALYESLFAHLKNVAGKDMVSGQRHSTSAHARHVALANKHGLDYKTELVAPKRQPGSVDGRYGSYLYELKSEKEIGIPLSKEEDPILQRLQHGDVTEHVLALKEIGVQPSHLRYAIQHDSSLRMIRAILEHPLFEANTNLVADAPRNWIKKVINSYDLEEQLFSNKLDKDALAHISDAASKFDDENLTWRAFMGIARQANTPQEALEKIAAFPTTDFKHEKDDVLEHLLDRDDLSEAAIHSSLMSSSYRIKRAALKHHNISTTDVEKFASDFHDNLAPYAAANPKLKGEMLDKLFQSMLASTTPEDVVAGFMKNPNLNIEHLQAALKARPDESHVVLTIAKHPNITQYPALMKKIASKGNMYHYKELIQIPAFRPLVMEKALKGNKAASVGVLEGAINDESRIKELQNDVDNGYADDDGKAELAKLQQTKLSLTTEQIDKLASKVSKGVLDELELERLPEASPKLLFKRFDTLDTYDNARDRILAHKNVTSDDIEAIIRRNKKEDNNVLHNVIFGYNRPADVDKKFKPSWLLGMLDRKNPAWYAIASDDRVTNDLAMQMLPKFFEHNQSEISNLIKSPAHMDWVLNKYDSLPRGRQADSKDLINGIINEDAGRDDNVHVLTPETLEALHKRGFTEETILHPNAPSHLIDASLDTPNGRPHALVHPKLSEEKMLHVLSDPSTPRHDIARILKNPSLKEHHIQKILDYPKSWWDDLEETDPDTANSIRLDILSHPEVPHTHVAKEYERLHADRYKLNHKGNLDTGRNEDDYYDDDEEPQEDPNHEYITAVLRHMEQNNPDRLYKPMPVKPNVQRLRVIRDQILDSGSNMIPAAKLPAGNWDRFRVITGDPKQDRLKMISADKIQQAIDSTPDIPFTFNLSQYNYDAQKHVDGPQTVFQLNLSNEQLRKIKEAGALDTWRKVQKYIKRGGVHPVGFSSLGWVRFTGDPAKKSVHVEEVQSDHRATMTSREVNDKKRELLGDKKWRELTPEEQADITAKLEETRKKYDAQYPEADQKKIMQILTGNGEADIHDLIADAFHKWLYDNYGTVKVHYPGREFRATLSGLEGYPSGTGQTKKGHPRLMNDLDTHIANLVGAKEAHFKATQAPAPDQAKDPKGFERHTAKLQQLENNVRTHQLNYDNLIEKLHEAHQVSGNVKMREPPAHYDDTYEKLPKRTGMAINAAVYGDQDTEENLDDYGGMPMHISYSRKHEQADYDLRKSLDDVKIGNVLSQGRHHSILDMSDLLSIEHRRNGYTLEVGTGLSDNGHYVNADIKHHGKYIGGAAGFVTPTFYNVGDLTPYRKFEIENATVDDDHRGKGLGTTAYEAMMAVAKQMHGATHVAGGKHSSGAANMHAKIAAKHGMDYKPEPNVPSHDFPTQSAWNNAEMEDYDNAFKEYEYLMKSGFGGRPVPPIAEQKQPIGRAERYVAPHGTTFYDYSNVFDQDPDWKDKPRNFELRLSYSHRNPDSKWGDNSPASPQLSVLLYAHHNDGTKSRIGQLHAHHDRVQNGIHVDEARVDKNYRGQGLGQKMYEALYGHAANALGVTEVFGGSHSDDAHHMHMALAQKHGLNYRSGPNVKGEPYAVGESDVQGPYSTKSAWHRGRRDMMNGRWGKYRYNIG